MSICKAGFVRHRNVEGHYWRSERGVVLAVILVSDVFLDHCTGAKHTP